MKRPSSTQRAWGTQCTSLPCAVAHCHAILLLVARTPFNSPAFASSPDPVQMLATCGVASASRFIAPRNAELSTSRRVPDPPGTITMSSLGASAKLTSATVLGPVRLATGPAFSAISTVSTRSLIMPNISSGPNTSSSSNPSNTTMPSVLRGPCGGTGGVPVTGVAAVDGVGAAAISADPMSRSRRDGVMGGMGMIASPFLPQRLADQKPRSSSRSPPHPLYTPCAKAICTRSDQSASLIPSLHGPSLIVMVKPSPR